MDAYIPYLPYLYLLIGTLMLIVFLRYFGAYVLGVVSIPNDRIGIVTINFVLTGKNKTLPDGHVIALNGEAGIQADTLAPGLYFFWWPWQYSIEKVPFVMIPQGQLAVVEARDGAPIPAGRVLADAVACDSFQDARAFLTKGGQRGPQLTVMPPGTYRINPKIFLTSLKSALEIPADTVGIVTTREGAPLAVGEIAGKIVAGHSAFQDGSAFVKAGGSKGLQEQVLLTGTYYTNPSLVGVAGAPLTSVPIGSVGVVISYVGDVGGSSPEFKQGNIVERGKKGVWATPFDPGRYPINPNTTKIELVPTTNIVLNWAEAKTEAHKLDANLSTITVRSKDGFTFNLDVSQIIHISRDNAARVIARFGNMQNLVTQVLEPLIGNYFRNSAQGSDVIDFLRERSTRQKEARDAITEALAKYDVQGVDTLIGDIVPPEELMKTLTDRKVAEQKEMTYANQQKAEVARQELEQATAMANTRAEVVAAERRVTVAENDARSQIAKAAGDAKMKTVNAEADASVKIAIATAEGRAVQIKGEAEGAAALAVGNAEATVLKNKVEAVGAEFYTRMRVVEQLSTGHMKLVPDMLVTGSGGDGGQGGLVNALLGSLIAKKTEAAA